MTSTHLWITLLVILFTLTLPSNGQISDLCFTIAGDEALQVAAIYTNLTAAEWYNYGNARANTKEAFEEREINKDRVTMFFIDASDGIHLCHMVDAPNSGTGGALNVDYQVSPARIINQVSLKVDDDPGETKYSYDTGIITGRYRWNGRLMDGMVLGPFATNEPYCVTVIKADGAENIYGYSLYDDHSRNDYSGPIDTLLGLEICTVECYVPPPFDPTTVSPSSNTITPTAAPTISPSTNAPTTVEPTTTSPSTAVEPTPSQPAMISPTEDPLTWTPTTESPTIIPTSAPSMLPTSSLPPPEPPTTRAPTSEPPTTNMPLQTIEPTRAPTQTVTSSPTSAPTESPSMPPNTESPMSSPTVALAEEPTTLPSNTTTPLTEEPTAPFETDAIVVAGDGSGGLPWWVTVLIVLLLLILCCCCCVVFVAFFWKEKKKDDDEDDGEPQASLDVKPTSEVSSVARMAWTRTPNIFKTAIPEEDIA